MNWSDGNRIEFIFMSKVNSNFVRNTSSVYVRNSNRWIYPVLTFSQICLASSLISVIVAFIFVDFNKAIFPKINIRTYLTKPHWKYVGWILYVFDDITFAENLQLCNNFILELTRLKLIFYFIKWISGPF